MNYRKVKRKQLSKEINEWYNSRMVTYIHDSCSLLLLLAFARTHIVLFFLFVAFIIVLVNLTFLFLVPPLLRSCLNDLGTLA